jgi:signal transduction histidine kinase
MAPVSHFSSHSPPESAVPTEATSDQALFFVGTNKLVLANNDHIGVQETRKLARANLLLGRLAGLYQQLSTIFECEEVFSSALQQSIDLFDAEAGALFLTSDQGDIERRLVVPEDVGNLQQPTQYGSLLRTLARRRPLRVVDPLPSQLLPPGRARLLIPLWHDDQPLGILVVTHSQPDGFDEYHHTIAEQVATAISGAIVRARHFAHLQLQEQQRQHMITMLVHDIRSPLMATSASIEVVQRLVRNEPPDSFLHEALTSGMRTLNTAVGLTNDMLTMRKIEAGQSLELTIVGLNALIQKALATVKSLAVQQGVTLNAEIESPDLAASLDPHLMHRVLVNLLANALRFTPKGGSISVSAYALADAGCEIVVDDTGSGVDPALREQIFQPFAQAPGELHRGSGLGLAFCHEAVTAHHGHIHVEDAPDGGARFVVRLP